MTKYVYAHGRRIEVETFDTGIAPRKHRKEDLFAKVPLWWAAEAAKATKAPEILVCVDLLHRAWKEKGKSFTMPNGWLEKNGMDRRVKYRVLRNLEAAKLIKADWRNGKNPLITWIACDL
jgi:hypothetical protein